jgi:hypothetical protein
MSMAAKPILLEVERQCIHQKHRSSRTEVSRVQGISPIYVRFWLPPKLARMSRAFLCRPQT